MKVVFELQIYRMASRRANHSATSHYIWGLLHITLHIKILQICIQK